MLLSLLLLWTNETSSSSTTVNTVVVTTREILVPGIRSIMLRASERKKAGIVVTHAGYILDHVNADRAYVMELGKVVLSGPADELARDNSIQDRYLGAA